MVFHVNKGTEKSVFYTVARKRMVLTGRKEYKAAESCLLYSSSEHAVLFKS